MQIIKPSVEYWAQGNDREAHIARCAAICYKSQKYNKDSLINHLTIAKHFSMFRHATRYYILGYTTYAGQLIEGYLDHSRIFGISPFLFIHKGIRAIYVSANEQYIMEHTGFERIMSMHEVSFEQFVESTENKDIIRLTFCITTSIKVSRELNRVSPNNIAEQSTRYVNFLSKNGNVAICESVDEHLTAVDKAIIAESLTNSTNTYMDLISSGVKPEDARRVLPLDTATVCAYTYSVREWKHIIDLRYFGTTGKPAPDAKVIGEMLYNSIKELGYYD